MKDGLIISFLSIMPKKPIARIMGMQARLRLPRWAHRQLVKWFVWKYDVNLEECIGEIDDFRSLSDFFLRPLLPDVRPIDQDEEHWVSPVDGTVHCFGDIENGRFEQSQSQYGEIAQLIGCSKESLHLKPYLNGQYAIIYLSPKDYHRVHSSQEGKIDSIRYIPGRLWPVFPSATRKNPNLFDRNERLIFRQQSPLGEHFLAMIGAFGVGRMTTSFSNITTNTGGQSTEQKGDWSVKRAQEIGCFELGSTVILLWPNKERQFLIKSAQSIRLGTPIARRILSITKD